MRLAFAAVIVLLAVLSGSVAAQGPRPSGERLYRQHCAGCHESSLPRMPGREALKALTPEQIETALSSFTMRRQGAALNSAEQRAVAEFLSGRPPGSYQAPLEAIPRRAYCGAAVAGARGALSGPSWNGWGRDIRNTRFQPASSAGLLPADVPRLKLKWAFGFPGVSAAGSQVTVVGSRAFVGSRNGVVYALDTRTGCLVWTFEADAGVRSTPVVVTGQDGTATVYVGDAHAQVYALNATTGAARWKATVESHPDAVITGGIAYANGRLFVPVSSLEELSAVVPTYTCCTFRGSVVALDAGTGAQVWKTYTIPDRPEPTSRSSRGTQLFGPSGASVWSAPAIDIERNRLFIATGNSYSHPVVGTSNAIIALGLNTGRVQWVYQALAGDVWNRACGPARPDQDNCPKEAGPDFDFGSSPALVTLPDGRRIVVAGQKSGELHAIDADTGRPIWRTRMSAGGWLGGIEWGFATDGTVAYVSLSEVLTKRPGGPGGLAAIGLSDGRSRWSAPAPANTCTNRRGCSTAQPAAVSAVTGVVFSGSLDGHVRAYDSASGKVVWDVDTAKDYITVNDVPAKGGSLNGPGVSVAGGMVFVSSGYGSLGFMPGNVLLAFSIDGR